MSSTASAQKETPAVALPAALTPILIGLAAGASAFVVLLGLRGSMSEGMQLQASPQAAALHGLWIALVTALVLEGMNWLAWWLNVPVEPAQQRQFGAGILKASERLVGYRKVHDDRETAVAQLLDDWGQRLSDRWSSYAVAAFVLGFGWLLWFLVQPPREIGPEEFRAGTGLLVTGIVESTLVLVAAALLWLAWRSLLLRWRQVSATLPRESPTPIKVAVENADPVQQGEQKKVEPEPARPTDTPRASDVPTAQVRNPARVRGTMPKG